VHLLGLREHHHDPAVVEPGPGLARRAGVERASDGGGPSAWTRASGSTGTGWNARPRGSSSATTRCAGVERGPGGWAGSGSSRGGAAGPPSVTVASIVLGSLPLGPRGRLAALALLLVGAGVAGLVATDPRPATGPRPDCAAVLVVALRGIGDPVDRDQGMGADTLPVVDRIRARLGGRLALAAAGFPYDTGPAWRVVDHVRSAAGELGAYLASRRRRCPGERLVLVGQSEGAAVIHLALPATGDQLAAVVLLADPARVAGAPYDTAVGRHDGVLARVLLGGWGGLLGGGVRDDVPASMASRVRSYCLPGDAVCDADPARALPALHSHVHSSYRRNPGGVADAAADFAAARALAGR